MSERLARLGRLGAEELTDLISTTFARLLTTARDSDGSLLKFGGDALLLAFTGTEHLDRAGHAAIAIRRELRSIGPIATSAGAVRLRMSAGLHTGDITLVLAGRSHRELIVAGPAASAVVRAESAAATGEIALSSVAAERLPSRLARLRDDGVAVLRRDPGAVAIGSSRRPVDATRGGPRARHGARLSRPERRWRRAPAGRRWLREGRRHRRRVRRARCARASRPPRCSGELRAGRGRRRRGVPTRDRRRHGRNQADNRRRRAVDAGRRRGPVAARAEAGRGPRLRAAASSGCHYRRGIRRRRRAGVPSHVHGDGRRRQHRGAGDGPRCAR